MSRDSEEEADVLENVAEVVDGLAKELQELYTFKNLFFENHPIELAAEKNNYVEEKKNALLEKFEKIDVDTQIPVSLRAKFLCMKGQCYNISATYDGRATQCLSKAVKLNPHLVDAWNELGESYWKNMNAKEAKASLEGALKHERNRLTLRCLSIILRQQNVGKNKGDATADILKSVELAKEAVAQDIKDGVSWTILGNAYLCQFFTVGQDPAILKLCMSAYNQAYLDPVARGQPDLYYNKGSALKYQECYKEALDNFDYACRLDPPWELPQIELKNLSEYLTRTNDLVRTRGKIREKKLAQMVQSIDKKMLGLYGAGKVHKFGSRREVTLEFARIDALQEGTNEGKVILGKVIGSICNASEFPFTFAIVDESMECVCVTVYNWAAGRGVIIGDCVAIPEPKVCSQRLESPLATCDFKSIRVNNPMLLLVNGKRVGREQFARIQVTEQSILATQKQDGQM